MPIGTTAALIAGGTALAGSVFSGVENANAAGATRDASANEVAIAQANIAAQQKARDYAVQLASATPAELQSISDQHNYAINNLTGQLDAVKQNQQILDAVDPAIKEAGQQAYQLLKGQESAILAPIKNQRSIERDQLKSQLRAQLGSGYETSSAGIEALNKFDSATDTLLTNGQQQALSTVVGAAQGLNSIRPDIAGQIGRAYSSTSGIDAVALQAQQNIQNRQVNAFTGSKVDYGNLFSAAQDQTKTAGGVDQAIGAIGSGVAGLGGTALGYGLQSSNLQTLSNTIKAPTAAAVGIPDSMLNASTNTNYTSPYFGPLSSP